MLHRLILLFLLISRDWLVSFTTTARSFVMSYPQQTGNLMKNKTSLRWLPSSRATITTAETEQHLSLVRFPNQPTALDRYSWLARYLPMCDNVDCKFAIKTTYSHPYAIEGTGNRRNSQTRHRLNLETDVKPSYLILLSRPDILEWNSSTFRLWLESTRPSADGHDKLSPWTSLFCRPPVP